MQSLDQKSRLSDSDANDIIDLIPDPLSLGDHEYELDNEDRDSLAEYIEKLDPRSKLVLKRRYGLEEYEPHTLDQIAKAESISRERARQIEVRALRKLRKIMSGGGSLGKIYA